MDTALTAFLGDSTTLFTALESVQAKAQNHILRFNEQTAAVSEMASRMQDAAGKAELGKISLVLYEVHALLFGRDTMEQAQAAVAAIGNTDTDATEEGMAAVAGEVMSLLDQSLGASARIEALLVQSAQRLSELEAAEV